MAEANGGSGLRYVKDGAIAWLVADNPTRMNALNSAMWKALPEAVGTAVADPDIRVVILRGAGDKAFSAGADISEFDKARTGDAAEVYDALNAAAFAHHPDDSCRAQCVGIVSTNSRRGGFTVPASIASRTESSLVCRVVGTRDSSSGLSTSFTTPVLVPR